MSIAWSDIEASGSFMRATNEDVFNSYVSGTTTSGTAVVSSVDTENYIAAMVTNSIAFAADTAILSIDSATQLTMSANSSLTADRVEFEIEVRTDANLAALYKTEAKEIMYIDIVSAYSNDPDQSDLVDDISDTNEDYLEMTLAYLQLAMYYRSNPDAEGSTNWTREQRYTKLYNNAKDNFRTLKTSTSGAITTGRIII